MFEFIRKEFSGWGKVSYTWNIIVNNTIIGYMNLVTSSFSESEVGGSNLYAYLYRDRTMYFPKEHIMEIVNDFKYLANNKLLDVDEEYRHFHYIEVSFDNELNNYYQI